MTNEKPHEIVVAPRQGRVQVRFAGQVVVDTTSALTLTEGTMRPVLYLPRKDAVMSAFEPTTRHTHCPFKGEASYFTLKAEGREAQNAVWTYETPLPGVSAIAGHLAFYPDQVEIQQS